MPDALSAEHCDDLPAPPLWGSRIREADPRGAAMPAADTESAVSEPPSLSLPHRGGGESPPQPSRSIRHAFVEAVAALRKAGAETPELDARLLVCHAAGLTHEAFVARAGEGLPPEAAARLRASLARRAGGEPVSRITGTREFYGRSFAVDERVLDPRPDTEILIEAALDLIDRGAGRKAPLRIVDLGTGSGCILITLLAELPNARGLGTDISADALRAAEANAARLGVAERASFAHSDWLEAVSGQFDLIVCNPPYIASGEIDGLAPEVARHDPRLALDGGEDGLDAYRQIARDAAKVLAPGGRILLEIGATQAEAVTGLLGESGLHAGKIGVRRDLAGRPRVLVAGA